MGASLTNGDKSHSLFISHLTSYPLVSDSLSAYVNNPYGARSVNILNDAYKRLFTPIEPYLKTPYSYVAPYLQKADSLGDKGLSEVDTRFPIVKEDTSTLKERVRNLPLMHHVFESTGYVHQVFEEESKKTNGQGILPFAKAVIGTELRIAADGINFLTSFLQGQQQQGGNYLQTRYEEGKKFIDQKAGEIQSKGNEYKKKGEDIKGEAEKKGKEYKSKAEKEANKAEKEANKAEKEMK